MIKPSSEIDALIKKFCSQAIVNESLVKAICLKESFWISWRTRFEPDYKYLVHPLTYAQSLGITMESEVSFQKTSWGLMQVMGGLARELGFDDYIPKLCLVETGLFYGIKQLNRLFKEFTYVNDVISAYNQGHPGKGANGEYLNQSYVDDVLKYINFFETGSL